MDEEPERISNRGFSGFWQVRRVSETNPARPCEQTDGVALLR